MKRTLTALGLVAVATALVIAGLPVIAADHLEAPLVALDGRRDINDLYAFQSPANPDNAVLIMTVNPLAGILSPTTFDHATKYEFVVDNDGDHRGDIIYQVAFQKTKQGETAQRVKVKALGTPGGGSLGSGLADTPIALANGGRVWAGVADDPFFFDLVAFLDQVKGAGGPRTFCDGGAADFFAGTNVSAIVVEVPRSSLGNDQIAVWARTVVEHEIIDRMGRPAIATVLIPDGSEDAFNATAPIDDVDRWSADVEASLAFLSGLDGSGYSANEAAAIASLLLPDVLTIDTGSSAGFVPGLNGRGLGDDVIDFELFVVTGGLGSDMEPAGTAVLTSDCVDANDTAFPGTFPYLAPAN